MRDPCGFALSVPDYVKRSCGFARIRPVPGRLWGVFNTPLHGDENGTRRIAVFVIGDENGTRRVAASVIGDENGTCGGTYTRFVSLSHLCVMENEYTHEHKI